MVNIAWHGRLTFYYEKIKRKFSNSEEEEEEKIVIYSLAVAADEHEYDRACIFLTAIEFCTRWWWWWCRWWCCWWRWHVFKNSPSELVLCYFARSCFLIGGNDEHDWPICDWLLIWEGHCVRDVPIDDGASGVWLWVPRRT